MADITQIPSAKVPLIYGGDVIMTTEWYRYFFNLYGFTGGGTGAIPTNKGGTGQIIYTDGQLLIGNSTTGSLDKATITGGAGINVTNGPGSIALSLGNSGVTPGNYGNASTVPQLTVNEYGIISAAANVAIAISATQIVSGIIAPARISGNYSGITGVGTITSGVWQGTSIGVPYGGTGLSSYTLGDMLYATGTTALSKLAIGANTYILASTGTAPQWVAPSTISIGTATNLAGGAANRIAYQTGISTTSFIVAPTIAGTYLNWSGSAFQWSSNPLGDVVGPASATDEAIARFDTTTGKLIQNSSATINDLGQLTLGTGSPFLTALLTIRADAGASVTPSISLDGYGASVYNLGFRRAGGTIASPTATTATAVTSILGATTGDGTTYANTSAIQSILEALATPTSQPTAFTFAVTPVGSTTRGEVLRLRSTGAVAFSGATNYGTSGQVLQSNGNAAPTWTNTPTLTGTNFSAIPNSALSNSTISGVALGGSLFNLTAGTGVSFSAGTTYNGSTAITINATGTGGTVTSVAALTLGTTGTDLSSTVANGTTTPVITLNVPTASAANRGALSSTDWSTFNNKQTALVSGTNIKTVSGVSLLGAGDVGTIGTAYGGTGLTTFTANRIFYASSTSVIAQSAGLTFDGTNFATTGTSSALSFTATGGRSSFNAANEPYAVGARYVSTGGFVYFGAVDGTATPDGQISNAGGSSVITFKNSRVVQFPAYGAGALSTDASGNIATGTLSVANGGTGQTTRQAAIDALAGAVTAGQYLRGDGTDVVMSAIQAADVPTLNQNTTGTASNVTGTVAVANGGTGLTSLTANRIPYGNGTSAYQSSANLTFNGTTLVANDITDSSLTAGRIIYAGASGNLVDSANLTFNGTNFTTTGSATATAFIPTGSTVPTNGMYLSSANTLAWATNSTFRMSLDNAGTLSTTGALSANTTVTAATSLRANLALGSGAGIDTSSQTGIVIAPSGNALLITGAAYYLVSIAEVTATGLNGVYVLGNGSVSLLGGIGWVATTTTPGAGTFSIAFSGGNYRIYNGFTPAGTYTFKATVIRMS